MPTPSTLSFIRLHAAVDPKALALQARKYPEVDMPYAITQISGRQKAAEKIPTWHANENIIYPAHLSLEQCSSELTARFKASLIEGDELLDLTGGFGIDCAFLSEKFKRATYVEQQPALCDIARANFPALGLDHIAVANDNASHFLQNYDGKADCIFLDPARRNEHGGKTVAIADCEPDVKALSEILLKKASTVMVKLSPMLDLTLALRDLPQVTEAYIVSVANECKELLLIMKESTMEWGENIKIHCVNLAKDGTRQSFSFTRQAEQTADCQYTSSVARYLYEPNASILKAGAYRSIAAEYQLSKLHPNSHLYTSDTHIARFPGRVFRCDACFSLHKKEIKEQLKGLEKANITVRNFPASVAELRKRLKLKEGGQVYLFATTLADERKVVIRGEKL